MKIIIILVVLALFLVSCAPTTDPGIKDYGDLSGWDNLGNGLYRKLDAQLNVACYYAVTGAEIGVAFSCVEVSK